MRLSVTPLPWCRRRRSCFTRDNKSRCRRRVFGMRKEKNASSSSKRLSETTKRDEKEERERESERFFVFVVVIHPLMMCCSRCLKARVRCVCFSAFEALFSIQKLLFLSTLKTVGEPKFLFDATCND